MVSVRLVSVWVCRRSVGCSLLKGTPPVSLQPDDVTELEHLHHHLLLYHPGCPLGVEDEVKGVQVSGMILQFLLSSTLSTLSNVWPGLGKLLQPFHLLPSVDFTVYFHTVALGESLIRSRPEHAYMTTRLGCYSLIWE